MNIKRIVMGLTACLGILAVSSGANASTADFHTLNNPVGILGSWHVVVSGTGNLNEYSVWVQADTGASGQNVVSTPDSIGHSVSVTFFDTSGNALNVKSTYADGAVYDSATNATSPVWGWTAQGTNDVNTDDPNAAWSVKHSAAAPPGLQADAGNYFLGLVTLSGASAVDPYSISASVQDGSTSHVWFSTQAVFVPEASSLALLLPGLLPVGLVLKRRKQLAAQTAP